MELSLLSSNIRFANPADKTNDWEFRRPFLITLIEECAPDILGTQEGREKQIRHLAAGLNKLTLIDAHREWIEERMYPCLFINTEKFEILRSGDIWLSETPSQAASKFSESAFPRLCVWVEVLLKNTNLKLMLVNTHLDHIKQDTRKLQARVLATEIRKLSSLPVILMGDFNESPATFIKEELEKNLELKDPWIEKKLAEETSHHSFKGVGAPGDRIDWILVPKNFAINKIELVKTSFAGAYPSDHFPLWATVIPK
jgi:endonuclease/exonuclease/phosphatase family metal-dependent hydrolase